MMRVYSLFLFIFSVFLGNFAVSSAQIRTEVFTDANQEYAEVLLFPDGTLSPHNIEYVFVKQYPLVLQPKYAEVLDFLRENGFTVIGNEQTDAYKGKSAIRMVSLGGNMPLDFTVLDEENAVQAFEDWKEATIPLFYTHNSIISFENGSNAVLPVNMGEVSAYGKQFITKIDDTKPMAEIVFENNGKNWTQKLDIDFANPTGIKNAQDLKNLYFEMKYEHVFVRFLMQHGGLLLLALVFWALLGIVVFTTKKMVAKLWHHVPEDAIIDEIPLEIMKKRVNKDE